MEALEIAEAIKAGKTVYFRSKECTVVMDRGLCLNFKTGVRLPLNETFVDRRGDEFFMEESDE